MSEMRFVSKRQARVVKACFLTASCLVQAAFAERSDDNLEKEYTGIFQSGFELSAFRPCNSSQVWWYRDTDQSEQAKLYGLPRVPVLVTVRGTVSTDAELIESGGFGHLGVFEREIRVSRVLSVEATREAIESCNRPSR